MCELAPFFSSLAVIFSDLGVPHVRPCRSRTPPLQKITPASDIAKSGIGVLHVRHEPFPSVGSPIPARVRSWGTPPSECRWEKAAEIGAPGLEHSSEHLPGAAIAGENHPLGTKVQLAQKSEAPPATTALHSEVRTGGCKQ